MKSNQKQDSPWKDPSELNLDEVSHFTALDILGSIAILGVAFGLVAPFLI